MRKGSLEFVVAAILVLGCGGLPEGVGAAQSEPIVGGPCEGCEAIFEGMPDALASSARIAPVDEPGEPMVIEGTVYDAEGEPVPGVVVYAYQTDAGGIYPEDESRRGQASYRHGRLRAWVETDSQGHYRFETIRPGGYPGSDVAQHVHMHVLEPGCCTYWIDSIHFEDDPRLTRRQRQHIDGRGGNGIVTPQRDTDGHWHVTRDIVLGQNIPGYPRR